MTKAELRKWVSALVSASLDAKTLSEFTFLTDWFFELKAVKL